MDSVLVLHYMCKFATRDCDAVKVITTLLYNTPLSKFATSGAVVEVQTMAKFPNVADPVPLIIPRVINAAFNNTP